MSNKKEEWIEKFIEEHKKEKMNLDTIWNLVPKGHRVGIGISSKDSLAQILRKYHIQHKSVYNKRTQRMTGIYSF